MLWLIESFRNFPCEHSVDGADHNQQDRVGEGDHVRGVDVRRTDEQIILARRIMMDGFRRRDYHPHGVDQHLLAAGGDGNFINSF